MNQPQKKRPQKTLVRSLHYWRKVSIAYYLTHRQEIEEYLHQQETAADALQEQLESNPDYQAEIAEPGSRTLGRWTAAQENGDSTPIG
jgi:hypothetical protein